MSLHKFRGFLYWLAKALGDWQALASGKPHKISRRVARRIAGKVTGRLLGRLFK